MEEKGNKKTVVLLIALLLGYITVYIDKLSVGLALVPISKEFGLEPSAKGMIMSAFFLGYAIMQIPMGFVINKFGSRIVLIVSVFGIGLFSFLFGLSTSLIMFVIVRFLTGLLSHSGYPSSASKEVTINVPAKTRTFAQGILLSSSGVASVVGPLLLSPVISHWGWKYAYYLITIIAVIVAICLIVIIPKNETKLEKEDVVATHTEKISIIAVWKDSKVWLLFFSTFFINSLLYGLSSWMPSFLTDERGLSLFGASKVTSVTGIFMLVGSIGGSYVVGKFFQNREKLVIMVTSVIGALLIYASYYFSSIVMLSIMIGLATFCLILSFVTMMSIPLRAFEGAKFAPSYATIATGGILGGFVAPTLIGQLVESSGGSYMIMFIVFLVAGILAAVPMLFMKQPKGEK